MLRKETKLPLRLQHGKPPHEDLILMKELCGYAVNIVSLGVVGRFIQVHPGLYEENMGAETEL